MAPGAGGGGHFVVAAVEAQQNIMTAMRVGNTNREDECLHFLQANDGGY
jgi:hypothetical protein